MPATYAKILVAKNGGATASGGITVAAGDSVQLTGENTSGWGSNPAPLWQIYDYPPTFTQPSGWSTDGTGVYFFAGVTPPAVVMPAIDKWGKFMLRLTVVAGAQVLVDEASALSMLSANGIEDLGWNEDAQFGGRTEWVHGIKRTLRVLDAGIGGGTLAGDVTGAAGSNSVVSLAHLTAGAVTFAASAGPVAFSQAQNTTGVGSAHSHYAEQGKAGSIGGTLTLGGGLGGTLHTNLPGALQLDGRGAVANVGPKVSILTDIGNLDISQTAAAEHSITSATGLTLNTAAGTVLTVNGGYVRLQPTNDIFLQAGTDIYLNPGSGIVHLDKAGTEYATVTMGTSPLVQFTLAATGGATINYADNVTNSATGADVTVAAQNATGTTTTGGTLHLKAGTGTSTTGFINFVLGSTTSAPGAGAAGALPATPQGYMLCKVNGTARKIPYY